MAAARPRPPLEGLRKQLQKSRAQKGLKQSRMPRDGFVRETFTLPRLAAREKRVNGSRHFPKPPTGPRSRAGASARTM